MCTNKQIISSSFELLSSLFERYTTESKTIQFRREFSADQIDNVVNSQLNDFRRVFS